MSYDATVCRFRCTICNFRCHFAAGTIESFLHMPITMDNRMLATSFFRRAEIRLDIIARWLYLVFVR
jgi:hypothetical protein